jgi:ABC-type multidrug transport system fused ATPase/permease subunit
LNDVFDPKVTGIYDLFRRLWFHIGSRRRSQFWLLVGLMVVGAGAEVFSIGVVLPFLAALATPETMFSVPLVQKFAFLIGITTAQDLLLPFTAVFIVSVVLTAIIRLVLLWVITRFVFATGADLSLEIYRRTLYQPYSVHIFRNSSEVISGITSKIHSIIFGELLPALTLVSGVIILISIIITLFVINPYVASFALIGFGLSYGLVATFTRRQLQKNGASIATEQTQVVKALQEGLGGIRDILLNGAQPVYCEIYKKADRSLQKAQGSTTFISQYPRFAMEGIGLVLIAILAYFASNRDGGISAALPTLGVMALGAQRLLPSMQQTYAAWASIQGSQAALMSVISLLDQPIAESNKTLHESIQFNESISLENISFRYSVDGPYVLRDIDLIIPKGSRVGIVGGTGNGKSTLLDILMGLLAPEHGVIKVDGKEITEDMLRAWQLAIAHVPQSIFLTDTSMAENIAFGIPFEEIDMGRVKEAARRAQLAEFIQNQPQGYLAQVGERGIRLSGGQRQRIGIARALYKQASVLIFDEATSALDNTTELALMDAIGGLDHQLTIFFVAHRLSTVRHCDMLVELEGGKLKAKGNYEQLLKLSDSFRKMVDSGNE